MSALTPQEPDLHTCANHVRRWHPQCSEALDAVSHSDVLMVLPSSTITSKVAKKSTEHRRNQAQKEHRLVETENARMRECGELCVQERNLVADQAHYNSGSMVATKATLVTALLREMRKVWLIPGDGVVTASENLASPPRHSPQQGSTAAPKLSQGLAQPRLSRYFCHMPPPLSIGLFLPACFDFKLTIYFIVVCSFKGLLRTAEDATTALRCS
jgi:hypothetical protein